MSGWIKCGDAKPADGQVVVVWRKWPHWDCFAAELDSWQADSSSDEGGAWYEAEESCQHIEICADGPGEVARPITTHWHPLPAIPPSNPPPGGDHGRTSSSTMAVRQPVSAGGE